MSYADFTIASRTLRAELNVLSVGHGDVRISLCGEGDVERGRTIIEKMMQEGYSIFVETDRGPRRVKKFNPARMVYIVAGTPPVPGETPAAKKGRATKGREVPVAGSRSTVVGRTAGG